MISIRKYLNGPWKNGNSGDQPPAETSHALALGVLEAIEVHVLSGEESTVHRGQVSKVRESIRAGVSMEEELAAAETVAGVLAEFSEACKRNSLAQAVEMQHIFAMLNQALVVLAEGRDHSVSRLNHIRDSLQKTSQIQDITAMKWALADTVRFIKDESARAHAVVDGELARFDGELTRARDYLGRSKAEIGGRPEGVAKIAESLQAVVPGEAVYLVAFLFDRLQSIIQRYGPDVAEELIFKLIRERIQPVAPENAAYRWTASSLVAVINRPRDLDAIRTQVTMLNGNPLVHKVSLGNRTAVLTITPSHLVAESSSEAETEALVAQVDRFTGLEA